MDFVCPSFQYSLWEIPQIKNKSHPIFQLCYWKEDTNAIYWKIAFIRASEWEHYRTKSLGHTIYLVTTRWEFLVIYTFPVGLKATADGKTYSMLCYVKISRCKRIFQGLWVWPLLPGLASKWFQSWSVRSTVRMTNARRGHVWCELVSKRDKLSTTCQCCWQGNGEGIGHQRLAL